MPVPPPDGGAVGCTATTGVTDGGACAGVGRASRRAWPARLWAPVRRGGGLARLAAEAAEAAEAAGLGQSDFDQPLDDVRWPRDLRPEAREHHKAPARSGRARPRRAPSSARPRPILPKLFAQAGMLARAGSTRGRGSGGARSSTGRSRGRQRRRRPPRRPCREGHGRCTWWPTTAPPTPPATRPVVPLNSGNSGSDRPSGRDSGGAGTCCCERRRGPDRHSGGRQQRRGEGDFQVILRMVFPSCFGI